MRNKLRQMNTREKIIFLLQVVVSVVILIFALLTVLGYIEYGLSVTVPLLGVLQIILGAREWKQSRTMAIISFAVAVFLFACSAAVWFL